MRLSLLITALWAAGPVLVTAQLNQLARAAGLRYFGVVTSATDQNNPEYKPIVNDKSEFGQWTDYSVFGWDATEPTQGKFTFAAGDLVIDQALSQGQLIRCSYLVDAERLPSWVTNGAWTKASLRAVLETHIKRVVGHFKGKCYSWDVVAHASFWDTDSYYPNIFYETLGAEYLTIAFKTAKLADPSAKLYYANSYGLPFLDQTGGILRIVDQLKKDRAPIGGLALEFNAFVNYVPDEDSLVNWLSRFTAQGLDVAYTGFQINLLQIPETECFLAQRDRDYQALINSCLRVCRCVGLTISNANILFDSDFNETSSYGAIASKLKERHQSCSPTLTKIQPTAQVANTPTSCPMPPLPHWAQCGGFGWLGSTTCEAPYTCVYANVDYSQCL